MDKGLKITLWIIGIFIFLGLIVLITGNSQQKTKSVSSESSKVETTSEPKAVEEKPKASEKKSEPKSTEVKPSVQPKEDTTQPEYVIDDIKIEIVGDVDCEANRDISEYVFSWSFDSDKETGDYCFVELKITNNSDDKFDFDCVYPSYVLQLHSPDGKEFHCKNEYKLERGKFDPVGGNGVSPTYSRNFWFGFEVPADTEIKNLHITKAWAFSDSDSVDIPISPVWK